MKRIIAFILALFICFGVSTEINADVYEDHGLLIAENKYFSIAIPSEYEIELFSGPLVQLALVTVNDSYIFVYDITDPAGVAAYRDKYDEENIPEENRTILSANHLLPAAVATVEDASKRVFIARYYDNDGTEHIVQIFEEITDLSHAEDVTYVTEMILRNISFSQICEE